MGLTEMNIRDLKICDAYIEFPLVSEAIKRIYPVIKNIETLRSFRDMGRFDGIGNWLEEIYVGLSKENKPTFVRFSDVFWACVCLGQEKVLCKQTTCRATENVVHNIIKVVDDATIQLDDRKLYRKRIDEVCSSHDPRLTVEWPAGW